jgi:hypothetical protein
VGINTLALKIGFDGKDAITMPGKRCEVELVPLGPKIFPAPGEGVGLRNRIENGLPNQLW